MEATFFTRNVYGETKVYPLNGAALAVAQIARTKTLRREDMLNAEILGVKWKQASDPEHDKFVDFCTLYF